ncbi:RHS repeat-associated protein [Methanococcus maripaludis]|uniref:RHS repeat-associated protein n=1 Tax=Methanococcus maripaludis TaxID=39152 RepID=A0A7J9SBU9_METMI|nr:RHS repeat-associated core domain-containing protein [Methanococcus maripaludis]MBB6402498.1 RHS repeat-associated protein [Methanococcus maripaludis]
MGSTNLLVNENGSEVERSEYFPYGQVQSGGSEKYGFTGQENDANTELMYYGARYYSPEYRIFIQPDTMLPSLYNPQALNRYSYTLNNPVKYTDPSGHYVESALDIGFILMDVAIIMHEGVTFWNVAALAADGICLAAPIATGGGIGVRAVEEAFKLKKLGYSNNYIRAVLGGQNILKSANRGENTVWLAEGTSKWGWNHIVQGRHLDKADSQFVDAFGDKYSDLNNCKDLIMETVENGKYYDVGDGGIYFMQVNKDYYLKVAVTDYGSITTAMPKEAVKAEKEIAKLGAA